MTNSQTIRSIHINAAQTAALKAAAAAVLDAPLTAFEKSQQLAPKLGAHYQPADGTTAFGFWLPALRHPQIALEGVRLELFTALEPIDFEAKSQTAMFERVAFQPVATEDFVWLVLDGVQAGSRERAGAFYRLVYADADGRQCVVQDPLAYSVPFGVFSPAEVYDIEGLLESRSDMAYFEALRGVGRQALPANILQLHVPTSFADGNLAALTRQMRQPTAHSSAYATAFAHYEAVQLLPVMPISEYEDGTVGFLPSESEAADGRLRVGLRQLDLTNWGYDIVIAASSAVNPVLLKTKRPDEFLELLCTLHNAPQPLRLILDVVYGHADGGATKVLADEFFDGNGMYGKEMNFAQPTVRAIMLEAHRRIGNYGVDGFRVDASQDITVWDAALQKRVYDSLYLQQLHSVELRIKDIAYQPFMIYEDGRPWPQDDWNISATYRAVQKILPDAAQWNPMMFSNNKPFLYGFWLERFWRMRQVGRWGEGWITGIASHDSVRCPAHTNPVGTHVNTGMGADFKVIAHAVYNNPAARLVDHCFLPGMPMEFLHASAETPWGFYRNTDTTYGVKILLEERHFLKWFVNEASFQQPAFFQQLKRLGFGELSVVRQFTDDAFGALQLVGYDLEQMLAVLRLSPRRPYRVPSDALAFKAIAKAYMEDVHVYNNVAHHLPKVAVGKLDFMASLRAFRLQRPALRRNLAQGDQFEYWDADDAVLYYGRRVVENEAVAFIANMEGSAFRLERALLEQWLGGSLESWEVRLQTPDTVVDLGELRLAAQQAVCLVKPLRASEGM